MTHFTRFISHGLVELGEGRLGAFLGVERTSNVRNGLRLFDPPKVEDIVEFNSLPGAPNHAAGSGGQRQFDLKYLRFHLF